MEMIEYQKMRDSYNAPTALTPNATSNERASITSIMIKNNDLLMQNLDMIASLSYTITGVVNGDVEKLREEVSEESMYHQLFQYSKILSESHAQLEYILRIIHG